MYLKLNKLYTVVQYIVNIHTFIRIVRLKSIVIDFSCFVLSNFLHISLSIF